MIGRTRLGLICLIFLLAISSAFGALEVTYTASNVQNFEITGHDCIDSACNTDGSSSLQFPDGTSTTNGQIRVLFPDSLATPFGYAVYFAAQGYIPKVDKAENHHTFGNPGIAQATVPFTFDKKEVCAATVDNFAITNDVTANIPLVIRSQASLDSTAHSPVELTQNGVEPIPTHFLNEHYGIDTNVYLDILDLNGNIVQSFPPQEFSADNGNPLIFSESRDVQFTWIPVVAGQYAAQMRTEVVDDQCETFIPQTTTKPEFTVLSQQPQDVCFVQTNGLRVDNPNPQLGDTVTVEVDVTANHADGFGQLTPTTSQLVAVILGPNSASTDNIFNLPANNGPEAQTFSFQFTAQEEGPHQVLVSGLVNDPVCAGLNNIEDHVNVDVTIESEPLYDLEFVVRDQQSQGVVGAEVFVEGGSLPGTQTLTTDAAGIASLENLEPGVYQYTISKQGFSSVTGSIEVTDFDRTVFTFLQAGHVGPQLFDFPDLTISKNAQQQTVLNLDDYVIEGNIAAEFLGYQASATPGLVIDIEQQSPHGLIVSSVGTVGTETITVTVFDSKGFQATQSITVNVQDSNTPPTISNLPDVSINEGEHLLDAFLLDNFAQDAETQDRDLTFTIKDTTNPAILVEIDSNNFVDVKPAPNVNGQTTVTIEVADEEGLTAVDSFTVTVGAVNTAPFIINNFDGNLLLGAPLVLDLSLMAVDEDHTAQELTWSASIDSGVAVLSLDNNNKLLTFDPVALGTGQVTLSVVDPDGLSDENIFTVNVVNDTNPECSDGFDNDLDGFIDFPFDPQCADANDDDESALPPPPGNNTACSDGLDNDNDLLVDLLDPGCTDANDNDEFDSKINISNVDYQIGNLLFTNVPENSLLVGGSAGDQVVFDITILNEYLATYDIEDIIVSATVSGNGFVEFDNENIGDLGPQMTEDEALFIDLPTTIPAGIYDVNIFADGFDEFNGDLVFDSLNFQIQIAAFNNNTNGTGGNGTNSTPACSDGLDNDADGLIDFPADPGCSNALDNDEFNAGNGTNGTGGNGTNGTGGNGTGGSNPACSDGLDNDGDGLIDFPADPGCANADDLDELDGVGDFQVRSSDIDLEVEEIRIPQAYNLQPGGLLVSYVKFENEGNVDIDNLKISMSIDELGIRTSRGPDDLNRGDRRSETLVLDVPPGIQPGYYWVRMALSSDTTKRTVYREVQVQ